MRRGLVYRNEILAGELIETDERNYVFRYNEFYLNNKNTISISLTLPKGDVEFKSNHLFPFFFNLLSEGVNRNLQCRQLKIDERDDFGLLLATAQYDTIGPVTIKPQNQ